ncbi:lanthionine synthetase LanC family protein [Dactylosporangium sp. NPDC051485]|uniref:lanthionine synthetase LanC family protein n=1 Tax=Dactylosporangium sp. NPDC051485 TaxID=3154846 RepID=UPI00342909D1
MYRELGEAAWAWVLGHVRDDDGPWLPEVPPADAPAGDRDSLYAGIAGLAPVLAEIALTRPWTAAESDLAGGIVARLTRQAATRDEPSLYDGLAGDVTALRLLAPGTERVALDRLAELRRSGGWDSTLGVGPDGPLTDVVMGTAGIVMAAVWAGDRGLAEHGGEALLAAAEGTDAGLNWRMWPGHASSTPNFSHGTAGVAAALAVAGALLGRDDFTAAAGRGADHLAAIASRSGGGFVVEHTIPESTRDVEPVTYNWCHGPAGTSQLFAALGRDDLRRRCLHAVLTSGVPQRLRPGFWDNDGRCCGTAGVGDILLDAAQDAADGTAAAAWAGARRMGDALAERAIRDGDGVYWRFVEHRADPPLLPPRTTWMQGAAGIAAFLLRLDRVGREGLAAPVVDRPDQFWTVPEGLRGTIVP